MLQTKILPLYALDQVFHLSYTLLKGDDISTLEYRSDDICIENLLLPSGQTVAAFKELAKTEYYSKNGTAAGKLVELQNQLSQKQFGMPFQAIVEHQKNDVQRRYVAALASGDIVFRVTELHGCAREGHVQANMDLGVLFDAKRRLDCIDYFVEAHKLGHPQGLLYLSKTFFRVNDRGAAVRVLLLGAACGSVQCAAVLLELLKNRMPVFETAAGLGALEDGLADDTPHAKYILGFVFLYSASCRDDARGHDLMTAAAATRYRKGNNGKAVLSTPGGNLFATGTLGNFETLIDQELLAIRSAKMKPEFLSEIQKISLDGGHRKAEFQAVFARFNAVPPRQARKVQQWLANGASEPVDPVKLERMKALYLPDEQLSKEDGDE